MNGEGAIWIGLRRLSRWLMVLSMPQASVARAIRALPAPWAPLREPWEITAAPARVSPAENRPRSPRCSRPSSPAMLRAEPLTVRVLIRGALQPNSTAAARPASQARGGAQLAWPFAPLRHR